MYKGKEKEPNSEIIPLLGNERFARFNGEDYRKRMLYLMINEGLSTWSDNGV